MGFSHQATITSDRRADRLHPSADNEAARVSVPRRHMQTIREMVDFCMSEAPRSSEDAAKEIELISPAMFAAIMDIVRKMPLLELHAHETLYSHTQAIVEQILKNHVFQAWLKQRNLVIKFVDAQSSQSHRQDRTVGTCVMLHRVT